MEQNNIVENNQANLPTGKKKGKGIFLIGLVLLLISFVITISTLKFTNDDDEMIFTCLFIALPLAILAEILIFIGLLLITIKKTVKILLILLDILFISWFLCNFFYPLETIARPFMKLALAVQNEQICRFIPVIEVRDGDYCKNWCYTNVAIMKKDSSICDKVKNYLNSWCYSNIAKDTKNELICEKIGDQDSFYERDSCYKDVSGVTKNESICEKIIHDSYRDQCFENIAKTTKNESVCGKIIDEWSRNFCYNDVAKSKKDPSICEKITVGYDSYQCSQKIKEILGR